MELNILFSLDFPRGLIYLLQLMGDSQSPLKAHGSENRMTKKYLKKNESHRLYQ